MKIHSFVLRLSLIFVIVGLSSCIQSAESTVTLSSKTPSQPINIATPLPSLTALATGLPTPLPTDSPVPLTPTAIPTLSVEASRIRLLDLLASNSNCHLPCLWGMTPGKSSFKDAQTILVPLSSLSYSVDLNPPGPGGISPRYTEGDFEIYTRVGFLANTESAIINRIGFIAEAHKPLKEGGYEDVFDSKFFGNSTSAYGLSKVLSEQGIPSSVMIATLGGPLTRGSTGGFDILLLYPDQGILVNYTTQMHLVGTNVRGCPLNAHVEMELYPSGQGDSFFELLKQTDWAVKMDYYNSIEDTTSMTLEEFYETFRESNNKCIETPANFWPTPEP